MLNPIDHPYCTTMPEYLSRRSAWVGHIPFAFTLVSLLRPASIVELGTHWGDSYCAFCQAVDSLQVEARCVAVDTWEGDPHTRAYGPEVLGTLRAHHDTRYGRFSTLLRSTFDDARAGFARSSVDLLHIDGFHTYEAVAHDVETWLPVLSDRGVLLLHDSAERGGDFGVWRLVEELRRTYPLFEFTHSAGLAVVAVGSEVPPEILALCRATPAQLQALGAFYASLAALQSFPLRVGDLEKEVASLRASLSWRITAPLRGMCDALSRARGRTPRG